MALRGGRECGQEISPACGLRLSHCKHCPQIIGTDDWSRLGETTVQQNKITATPQSGSARSRAGACRRRLKQSATFGRWKISYGCNGEFPLRWSMEGGGATRRCARLIYNAKGNCSRERMRRLPGNCPEPGVGLSSPFPRVNRRLAQTARSTVPPLQSRGWRQSPSYECGLNVQFCTNRPGTSLTSMRWRIGRFADAKLCDDVVLRISLDDNRP